MQSLILILHVALAIGLIGLVLIQHGKGADAGAAFGSGASSTVFGARGSATFLTRLTTAIAAAFFVTSLTLFYFAANRDRGGTGSVTDLLPAATTESDTPMPDPLMPDIGTPDSDLPVAPSSAGTPATGSPAAGTPAADSDLPAVEGQSGN